MSDSAKDIAAKFPSKGGDIVVDPKFPLLWAFDLEVDEYAKITARGRWSTHPHDGPNFTGPSGDHAVLHAGWPEGCLVISAYRGHIPLESHPFTSDSATVTIRGPAKIGVGAQDDPKGFSDNYNDSANPMTITFKVYTS